MTKQDMMDQLVKQNNGYLQTADVVALGISKTYLSDYVQKRKMERVAHGVYMSEDAWPDNLYLLQQRNKEVILSHDTALYLFGLTEREPVNISVTIHTGYNASHLRKKGITVYTVQKSVFDLGRVTAKTIYGNTVTTYDRDRSICDLIMHKNKIEIQLFNTTMNEYMRCREKNLHNLMYYASALGIEAAVRTYTEVML
ncbi:MAG: type IV toxin-antitoxin system AbiEi family antitoxin domain-containing protein [Saccharofermentanales bacterium]